MPGKTSRGVDPQSRGMSCWLWLLIVVLLGAAFYILLINISPGQIDNAYSGQEPPRNLWQQVVQLIVQFFQVLVYRTLPELAKTIRQAVLKVCGNIFPPVLSLGVITCWHSRHRKTKIPLVK